MSSQAPNEKLNEYFPAGYDLHDRQSHDLHDTDDRRNPAPVDG